MLPVKLKSIQQQNKAIICGVYVFTVSLCHLDSESHSEIKRTILDTTSNSSGKCIFLTSVYDGVYDYFYLSVKTVKNSFNNIVGIISSYS
jgi:hypothetical protein